MDIDRMAKEWPEMKRRLDALEQFAGTAPQQQYPSAATGYTPEQVDEVQRTLDELSRNAATLHEHADLLIGRMEEATAALDRAREAHESAAAKSPGAETAQALAGV